MATNFELVGVFHEEFGHPKHTNLQKDVFTENSKLVNFRLDLINEEVKELHEAVRDNNMTEVADALGDILYVVNGMGHALGIDLDKVFAEVHRSNMTKLCKTEQEAIDSVIHYKTQPGFEDVDVGYRKSHMSDNYVIYNKETGKILKSKYFELPDFSNILVWGFFITTITKMVVMKKLGDAPLKEHSEKSRIAFGTIKKKVTF